MDTEIAKPSILLIDPLAGDRGHLIDDDLFLAKCISPLAGKLLLVTSPSSVANIKRHIRAETQEIQPHSQGVRFFRFRLFRLAITLPCSRFSHIIFQSFEEISILLFMFLHPRKHVHLIVTNNLRRSRLKRHPILGRYFQKLVFQRASSVIVHSQYEVDIVNNLFKEVAFEKIFIKPFHQFAFNRARLSLHGKSDTILFVGPEQTHKKIQPVVDFIKSDRERRYHYILCSLKDNIAAQTRSFLEAQENVRLSFGYVEADEYYRLFSEARLIMLTHDFDFEGTLSGAFCDAIASGTAIIARAMQPYIEFFQRFGPMGFLVDYGDPEWCNQVFSADLDDRYEEFQENMSACRKSCNTEAIREVFNAAIKRTYRT